MFIWCWWLCCPVSGSLFLVLLFFFFMGAVDWGLHYVKRLIFFGWEGGCWSASEFFCFGLGAPPEWGGGEGEPLLASLKGGGMGGARLGLGLPLSGDGSLVAVFLVLAWKGEAEFCVLLEEKVQFTSK